MSRACMLVNKAIVGILVSKLPTRDEYAVLIMNKSVENFYCSVDYAMNAYNRKCCTTLYFNGYFRLRPSTHLFTSSCQSGSVEMAAHLSFSIAIDTIDASLRHCFNRSDDDMVPTVHNRPIMRTPTEPEHPPILFFHRKTERTKTNTTTVSRHLIP